MASGDPIPFVEEVSDPVVSIDANGVVTVSEDCTVDVTYFVTVRDDVTGAPRQTRVLTYLAVDDGSGSDPVPGSTGAIWIQTDAYDGSCGGRALIDLTTSDQLQVTFELRPPSTGDRRIISASLAVRRQAEMF